MYLHNHLIYNILSGDKLRRTFVFHRKIQLHFIEYSKMFNFFKTYFTSKPKVTQFIHIEEIFKPLYLVSSMLGLFPCSVKFVQSKTAYEIIHKSIYINSLCGISIVLSVLVFSFLHIQLIIMCTENVSMLKAIMAQMNYIFELITIVVFCVVAYISAFLHRVKYVKVLNMVINTWFDLPKCVKSEKILRRLQFQVKFVTMVILLVVTLMQVCINFTRNDTLWKMILVTITFNLPQTIQFITIALYNFFVMMVDAILTNINELCLELTKRKTSPVGGVLEVKPKTISLRQLELAYVKAFEIKTYINEAFQGPILASTLQCFHSIVSESYIIYHGLVVGGNLSTHDIVNCSVWIIYQLIKVFTLSHAGSLLKLKAAKIGRTLHIIPTEEQDMRLLLEIQHFSSLISYQNIEMTVYEYFPLDATLIFNMLASAFMYLIILVQFDKKE